MRFLRVAFAILVIALATSPAPAQDAALHCQYGQIIAQNAVCRALPSVKGKNLFISKYGTYVCIIGRSGDYYRCWALPDQSFYILCSKVRMISKSAVVAAGAIPPDSDPKPYALKIMDAIINYDKAGEPSAGLPGVERVVETNYVKLMQTRYFHSPEGRKLGHLLRSDGWVQDVTQGGAILPPISLKPLTPPVPVVETYSSHSYTGTVAISATQGQWWKVEDTGGSVRFKDAAIIQNQFSAEIAVGSSLLKLTPKPVTLDFLVTVYDLDKKPIARDTVSVYTVSAAGGDYPLNGLFVTGSPAFCSIKFESAWTAKH